MCSVQKETEIKKALRTLCLSYGWSYGVFWRFHCRNSMLLTLEDAYCKEFARSLTDDMILQVHMLGDGVIGEAALDGKHRWVFSDSLTRIQQENSNFSREFSSGIKTVAVIPVEPFGVLQFGSVYEILETQVFVDHTRQIFRDVGLTDGTVPSGDATSSMISTTTNSLPISSCFDNQGEFLGGFVDNQYLDSLFQEPTNPHWFDEFTSTTESLTTLHQDCRVDDSDDLLQTLLAALPSSNTDTFSCGFGPHFGNAGGLDRPLETVMPKKGLFSELGLDQILSSIQDPICSPKKRRVESFTTKPQMSLWSDESFTKSCVTDQTKRPQESSKATKKRARPKDRQMIQDRIKELREIVPNSSKCSIDSLLDRTIKHMLFMEGFAKYIDKLKRVDAKVQRDGSTAWAIEVGGHNPIVVEDLGHSGELLIEMVCEEQGFFLEIADVIRGFGLVILKGVLEARDGKIRAHFIVEANRHVTRMEVLMSLVQLLKDSSVVGSNVFGNKTSSLLNNDYHQAMVSLPIGLR